MLQLFLLILKRDRGPRVHERSHKNERQLASINIDHFWLFLWGLSGKNLTLVPKILARNFFNVDRYFIRNFWVFWAIFSTLTDEDPWVLPFAQTTSPSCFRRSKFRQSACQRADQFSPIVTWSFALDASAAVAVAAMRKNCCRSKASNWDWCLDSRPKRSSATGCARIMKMWAAPSHLGRCW